MIIIFGGGLFKSVSTVSYAELVVLVIVQRLWDYNIVGNLVVIEQDFAAPL